MKRRGATAEEWAQAPDAVLMAGHEEALEGELRERVMDSFRGLPARWLEVCRCRWVEGWTRARTAEAMNMTVAEVRRIEEKARRQIIGEAA